jgi:hypothetical protein
VTSDHENPSQSRERASAVLGALSAFLVSRLNKIDIEQQTRIDERAFWDRHIRVAKWLNAITACAAVVGGLGLLAVYRQISESEDATVRANRAWLLVDSPSVIAGKSGEVETLAPLLNITNIGKEPASMVRSLIRPFWITPTRNADEVGNIAIDARNMVFVKNDTCDLVANAGGVGTIWPRNAPVTVSETNGAAHKGFANGSEFYGLQACVSYMTFGQLRHTRICVYYAQMIREQPNSWAWSYCQGEGQQWAD